MRIKISQETVYRYQQPVNGVIQMLRLTPRNFDGQYIVNWRIDVSENCQINEHEDAFGNINHVLTAEGALSELRIMVDGEVETQDTHGVVTGAIERFPPRMFLRETPLTQPDPAITDFAGAARTAASGDVLGTLHNLLDRLHEDFACDADAAGATAAEAFARKRGSGRDVSHVFIAAARSLDIPARYVGGHFHRVDGAAEQTAGHAWAEAFVPGLGWVAFDAANGACPADAHVRIAVALDFLGAAPVRGSRFGGGIEEPEISVRVSHSASQTQS